MRMVNSVRMIPDSHLEEVEVQLPIREGVRHKVAFQEEAGREAFCIPISLGTDLNILTCMVEVLCQEIFRGGERFGRHRWAEEWGVLQSEEEEMLR